MNEIERIEEERFVELLISLWIQPDAPEWIIDYARTELRKQRGLSEDRNERNSLMDEYNIKLLKFALKMGQQAIENVYETADFCENLSDHYFCMKTELAKILGVDYDDLSD